MNALKTVCLFLVFPLVLSVGCADDTEDAASASYESGTVSLLKNQGVDFATGEVQDPGTFLNSELRLTAQAGKLELRSGGPTATQERPVNWFKATSGYEHFDNLDAVPTTPLPTTNQPLLNAEPGHGFIIERADSGYIRGWISDTTDDSVTIVYGPLD